MKHLKTLTIALSAVFLVSHVSFAEDDITDTFSLKTKHIYASDVNAMSGEVEINESEFEFKHKFKSFADLPVEYALNFGHIDINEDVAVDLPSHLESRSLRVGLKFPVPFMDQDSDYENEGYFLGLDVKPTLNTDGFSWESGAFRMPVRTYFIYRKNEDFILVGGVAIRPDYDRVALPIMGLLYRPNERVIFNLILDEPHISYQLTDQTRLRWDFDYTFEEYEVTREGQKNVVLKYQDFSTGFGVSHELFGLYQTSLSVGRTFNRRLEYRDGVGKVEPDASLYTDFRISREF